MAATDVGMRSRKSARRQVVPSENDKVFVDIENDAPGVVAPEAKPVVVLGAELAESVLVAPSRPVGEGPMDQQDLDVE